MRLAIVGLVLAFMGLSACTGPAEPVWASDAEVARARYVHDGPPTLTLFTVIANSNGWGGHSALMINADERVIFDPAGTWHHPMLPERNDVHYGMAPNIVDFYLDYHTRVTWHTVIQEVQVTPEVAALVKRRAEAYGAVPKAQCSISIGRILSDIPGFEHVPVTYFPKQIMEAFDRIPGVRRSEFRDFDSDDNSGVIQAPPPIHFRPLAG